MNEDSVRGLLLGVKTQTRRLHKVPRYVVGDRVYVKERWRYFGGREYVYQHDRQSVLYQADIHVPIIDDWWTPMFMPEWASRVTLTISEVRVQNLHEITDPDAWAEGIEVLDGSIDASKICYAAKRLGCSPEDARATYGAAWDEMHRRRAPLVSNPMVVAYTFAVERRP